MSYFVLLALIAGLWWWNTHRAPDSISETEARKLLGVRAGADASEIRAAHHRLIARVHPDAGGSAALAARVNAARDLLVRKLEQSPPG
ncbi:MAG: J domain-containing protein [Sphingomonadaceae bacterium]|nr:J domain-containing protein [Sphingomonadaceae bacterium]